MATLIIYRGLPGCGKTTAARRMLATRQLGEIVRLNRDDMRRMGLDPEYRRPVNAAERRITTMRDASLAALLESGCDVIVDDTNLRAKYVRSLMEIAHRVGAEVEIIDMTDVPLDECIRRDALREGPARVGEGVIRDMHSRYLASLNGKPLPVPQLPEPLEPKPYVPPDDAPWCVMADMDGTLALLNGRSPYDESRVIDDLPNTGVISTLRALIESGYDVVFMSGRTEGCRADTETWLQQHVMIYDMFRTGDAQLFMRPIGDNRPDHVVKLELFDKYVRDRYDVRVVLDDRDQVVRLWRSLGLTCLQVADGHF